MTNDAAVAWVGSDFPSWANRETEQLRKLTRESQPEHGFVYPLYSATTVAELRAEVERKSILIEQFMDKWAEEVRRADAAERRVADLLQAVRELQIAESDVRIHEAMNPRSRNYRLPIYEAQRQARERLSALAKETP